MNRGTSLALSLVVGIGCAGSRGPSSGADVIDPVADTEASFREEAARVRGEIDAGQPVTWSRVEATMRGIVKERPGFAAAWFNLGLAQEQQGETDDAMQSYRRARAEDARLPGPGENLARLLLLAGEDAEAIQLLREEVERRNDAAAARVTLASRRLARGNVDDAERLCREALTYEPTLPEAYCILARGAEMKKQWGRVRLLAAQGFKFAPDLACLHEALGFAAEAEGETAASMKAFARAIESDPERSRSYAEIARISLELRDYAGAAAAYRKMAELDPDAAPAWVNLGIALKAQADFEGAREAYGRALGADDGSGEAHFNLGVLLLRHFDDLNGAEVHLKRSLQLSDGESRETFAMLQEIEARRQMVSESPPTTAEDEAAVAPAATPAAPAAATPAPAEPKPKPKSKSRGRSRSKSRKKAQPKPEPEPEPEPLPTDDDFE